MNKSIALLKVNLQNDVLVFIDDKERSKVLMSFPVIDDDDIKGCQKIVGVGEGMNVVVFVVFVDGRQFVIPWHSVIMYEIKDTEEEGGDV